MSAIDAVVIGVIVVLFAVSLAGIIVAAHEVFRRWKAMRAAASHQKAMR